MRRETVLPKATLVLALVAGCTGQIGGSAPSGTGGTGVPGSGGTTGTGTGGGTSTPDPGSLNLTGNPKYYRVVRLSNSQWANAVQTVLNVPSGGLEQSFEGVVTGTTDFSNNELVLGFDSRNWQDFQSAAETLASQVTATDAALAKVYSGTDPTGFIQTVGRRAYRRPLTTAEASTYMTLYNQGSTLMGSRSTFAKGASLVIRAMLQSPYFLFRTELGAKGAPLNAYEMAAKLSLWLRGTSPDDKTLDLAAGSGKLDTADGAASLATTMLGESATTSVMRQFHGEWLHFDDLTQISKVGVSNYNTSLNDEYLEASYRFFDNIFNQGLGVKEMLLSTTGFFGKGMAAIYGQTAPASGYAQADLGSTRVGYFSQQP